ncbi:MAG: hypothetical protein QJR12_14085 [Mycobacterium sp.]|uniref:hypothetical protein n=1 Tax=Mycobacterium sp. TaxID=1785 RepID=UPI002609B96A|nr:hypothetical protein [Mycobacterium sp.]MDI3315349.1 hypothetical protein [Mycobacterium sp.]
MASDMFCYPDGTLVTPPPGPAPVSVPPPPPRCLRGAALAQPGDDAARGTGGWGAGLMT